jgi:hypothetical protein
MRLTPLERAIRHYIYAMKGGRSKRSRRCLMERTGTSAVPSGGANGAATSQQIGALVPSRAAQRRRVGVLIAAGVVCVLAVVLLAGGGWGLWKDRVDREGGFVSIGTTELRSETYAISSELRGDGPGWLYGDTIMGEARVRATSLSDRPLFIGVASTSDVSRYLDGVGHGVIEHLATGELSTTNAGGAPSSPPSEALNWAASAEGSGEQTLLWEPRGGDWSIVLMNTDASAGVAVKGDLGAEFPPLPWVAGGLLIAGAILGAFGGWVIVREIRRGQGSVRQGEQSTRLPVSG